MDAGTKPVLKLGVYRHYKDKLYLLLGVARHSESLEWMAVYVPLYDNPEGRMWVRPASMWNEIVEWNGKMVTRFTFVEES